MWKIFLLLGIRRDYMLVINKMVDYLICKNIISSEFKDIYIYGLFVLFYNLFLVLNIIVDGIILHEFYFTIMFLIFWIPYRIFVGGAHCSTETRCLCFFNIYYLFALIIYKLLKLDTLILINIVLFWIQFYKEFKKPVFLLFWIVYACSNFIIDPNIFTILSIAYLCNSILKIYELFSNRKYLF